MAAAETIGEMQKRMDKASEAIGKAQAECEGVLTLLKFKSNCMGPDGLSIKLEEAMLIADSVIDLEGRQQIAQCYTIYRRTNEARVIRDKMQWEFESKIKTAMEEVRAAGELKGGRGGGEKKGTFRQVRSWGDSLFHSLFFSFSLTLSLSLSPPLSQRHSPSLSATATTYFRTSA